MKIFVYSEGHVALQNSGDYKGFLSLDVNSCCNPQFVAFELIFPDDCEIIKISDNNIIIRKEDLDYNKYNSDAKDAYRDKKEIKI